MVSISTRHDGAEPTGVSDQFIAHPVASNGNLHYGLVGLVLEVLVPEGVEFGAHFLQLFLAGANLEAGVDGVRRETSLLRRDLPLLEQLKRRREPRNSVMLSG